MPEDIQRCELVHMLNKKSNRILPLDLLTVALQLNYFATTNDLNTLLQNNAEASEHLSVATITPWVARKHAKEQTIMINEKLSICWGASSNPLKCLESSRDVNSFTC